MITIIKPIALVSLLMGSLYADFSIDFNTNTENWVKDNRNNGQVSSNLVHSGQQTTNAGCAMSDIPPSSNGHFIMSDDTEGHIMFFENSNNLNENIAYALNGKLSFDWINQTYNQSGEAESNSNEMLVILTGTSGIQIQTTFNGQELINSGWNTIDIPLTTSKWGSQLQEVLSNLNRIEIRVEAIAHGATGWSENCVDNEYYGIDSIKFSAPDNSVGEAYSKDGRKYTKFLHFADELANENQASNRLLTVDYERMEIIDSVDVPGNLNHHVDVMGHNHNAEHMMMVPKGSEFIEFRRVKDGTVEKRINLTNELGSVFKPRSADAYNETHNLILLTAANRPAAVVIDAASLDIVANAGLNINCNGADKSNNEIINNINTDGNIYECKAPDFGGSQISGHPLWINSNHFAIIDRTNRRLHVYKIEQNSDKTTWSTTRIQTVKTNTSLHQLLALNPEDPNNSIIYGLTEGNKLVKKPTVTVSNENPNIAEFTLEGKHNMIMDLSFPADAFGGLNRLIIEDIATSSKVWGGKGFADHTGSVTPKSDHKGNREYDYRVGYPNEYVNRHHLYNKDGTTPKKYRVYCLSYATHDDYKATRNPTYNQLKIVDNEIRFNNPNSAGVVGGESRNMDNSLYNDAQLLLGMRPFDDRGSPLKHIGSELYKFEFAGNQLHMRDVIQLRSGSDRGFFGHNLYMTPDKEYLYAPVGLSYDNGPHGIPFNGGLFIVDREEFKISRWHKTGKGAGHVNFSEKHNIAVLTHHGEHYVTLFDMRSKRKLNDISLEQKKKSYSLITQSHAPFIDGDYFYNSWVDGGSFIRIDLERKVLDSYLQIFTDGMPIHGNPFNREQ